MSNRNKAARSSGNYSTPKDGRLTASIVSNSELLTIVGGSALFVALMLAVPTVMAVLKQMGVW